MKNRKIKLNWGALVMLLMLIFFIVYIIYQHFQISSSFKFTVAEITKIEIIADGGGPIATCTYKVNGKIYNRPAVISNKIDIFKIGRKFYIKFYTKNPYNSELTEISFLDTLIAIPPTGWDRIPNDK